MKTTSNQIKSIEFLAIKSIKWGFFTIKKKDFTKQFAGGFRN